MRGQGAGQRTGTGHRGNSGLRTAAVHWGTGSGGPNGEGVFWSLVPSGALTAPLDLLLRVVTCFLSLCEPRLITFASLLWRRMRISVSSIKQLKSARPQPGGSAAENIKRRNQTWLVALFLCNSCDRPNR